jgi:hypothetical protein
MSSRRVAMGLVAAFGSFGAFWGAWAALLPAIKTAVHGSDSALGLAFLGTGLGALPAMAATGPLYDRCGERTLMPVLAFWPGLSVDWRGVLG